MPEVHTGTEGGRDEAAGNRDCAGGGSSPSASVDQMQRELRVLPAPKGVRH